MASPSRATVFPFCMLLDPQISSIDRISRLKVLMKRRRIHRNPSEHAETSWSLRFSDDISSLCTASSLSCVANFDWRFANVVFWSRTPPARRAPLFSRTRAAAPKYARPSQTRFLGGDKASQILRDHGRMIRTAPRIGLHSRRRPN